VGEDSTDVNGVPTLEGETSELLRPLRLSDIVLLVVVEDLLLG